MEDMQKTEHPLPSMPQCANLSEAESAIQKIARMQRMQSQKHAWLKWSGVDAAIAAGEKMSTPHGRDTAEDDEHRLVAKLAAHNVHTNESAKESAPGTPSLSQSPTPSTPTASPVSPVATHDAQGPANDVPLVQPQASHGVPRELLNDEWDSPSSDSSEGGWASDSSDAASDTEQIPSRLNLAHADVMTNKQMRRQLRTLRKLRPERQDQSDLSLHADQLRHQVAHGLQYASKTQRKQRAMDRYTPAVSAGETSDTDLLLPGANITESRRGSVPSRHSSPGIPEGTSSSSAGPLDPERPHVWKRRQRKAWNNAPSAMDQTDASAPCPELSVPHKTATPTPVAQNLFGHKSEVPPKGYTTELVYDMLHENQRGIVLFGVAKRFSSQVLFVGDPSPWTDATGANTALDTSTMQLPDPSWEWVQPTWLVDMTCDTDEEGWQYSGSFTGLQVWRRPIHFSYSRGWNQWMRKLYLFAKKRSEHQDEKRRHEEATRADEGLVAVMRSARSRTLRWHGVPSTFTFVRRRRWVRLRRRLVPIASDEDSEKKEREPATVDLVPLSDSDSDEDAPEAQQIRELRSMHQVFWAKHRLHMLMPLFMIPPHCSAELLRTRDEIPVYESAAWSRQFGMLLAQETRVQNPFIALQWVQRWLQRDDLAFVTSSLRAAERRYQKKHRAATSSVSNIPPHDADTAFDTTLPPEIVPAEALAASGSRPSLIREAVIEWNTSAAIDTMKLCPVDRLKIDLWYVWLGVSSAKDLAEGGEREVGGPIAAVQHERNRHTQRRYSRTTMTPAFSSMNERILRSRIYDYTQTTPMLLDVWDVLIAHLHEVIAMFEHERSRRTFLHLLHRLQSTDFRASTHTCENASDARWRTLRPGVVRLPPLPAL